MPFFVPHGEAKRLQSAQRCAELRQSDSKKGALLHSRSPVRFARDKAACGAAILEADAKEEAAQECQLLVFPSSFKDDSRENLQHHI